MSIFSNNASIASASENGSDKTKLSMLGSGNVAPAGPAPLNYENAGIEQNIGQSPQYFASGYQQQGGGHLTHGWIRNLQNLANSIEATHEQVNSNAKETKKGKAKNGSVTGCCVVIGSISNGDGASSICDNLLWVLRQNMVDLSSVLISVVERPTGDGVNIDLSRPTLLEDVSAVMSDPNVMKINLISPFDPRISIATARAVNMLLESLRDSVDIVVVDVPGFEVNSLGYLIARRADSTLIVAKEDRYVDADIEHVMDELQKSEVEFGGFVLNFVAAR